MEDNLREFKEDYFLINTIEKLNEFLEFDEYPELRIIDFNHLKLNENLNKEILSKLFFGLYKVDFYRGLPKDYFKINFNNCDFGSNTILSVGGATNVTFFNCNFKEFPELKNAQSLMQIDLFNCTLESINNNFISLNNSQVTEINIEQKIDIKNLELIAEFNELQSLRVSGFLTKIPESFYNLKQLNYLNLSNNFIEEISNKIKNLNNLRTLSLESNRIFKIPKKINRLTELKNLMLNDNLISKLPKEIFEIKNLEHLDLNKNDIEKISNKIIHLTNLHTLYLQGNYIKNVPVEILKLKLVRFKV